MRSLALQTEGDMGGRGSVLSRQKRDHIRLDRLLHELGSIAPNGQGPVLLRIYRLVFPHAFAEESVLWPAMRRVLPDGEALTLRVEQEHQEINELVRRFGTLDSASPERQDVLDRILTLLRDDVRDEEDLLLPRLQQKLTPGQLRRLGLTWQIVRAIAPTRAHPVVSRRPPGNVISALPLAVLDRLRDAVDAMIHRRSRRVPASLRVLSAALARASHAVEWAPGMRSGEDGSTHIQRPHLQSGPRAVALIGLTAAAAGLILLMRVQTRRETSV